MSFSFSLNDATFWAPLEETYKIRIREHLQRIENEMEICLRQQRSYYDELREECE
jgi:hypothetical protein